MSDQRTLTNLLRDVRACTHCAAHLPLGPNPVVRAHPEARILVIGQAPGTKVHRTHIPWNDPSGVRLRQWMALPDSEFYNEQKLAIIPMGLCYPGKGRSGDLPPRPECAPKWHPPLMAHLPNIQLTLLIGQHAQKHYLQDTHKTLTARVQHWREARDGMIPLPHPSPRNTLWLKRNPWFERELVPALQQRVQRALTGN